ncbi:major capsid protein [Salmonella enterica subsp. enterica]|nr:major capsid protein [Salmonella enterica subsp. enterica serovar Paratyphi A]
MPVNMYETRTMLDAISQLMPVQSFLKDTFFPGFATQLTEKVEVDYKKGKRLMAPFVAPRIGGQVIDRQGFNTKTFKTGKIAPERIITIDDVNKRSFGENIYSQRTPAQRAQEMLADDLIDLDEQISRREEWMCREVLLNGKVVMSGEGFEQVVDYDFTNKEALIGTDKWTDFENSDPLAYLKEKRLQIIKATGMTPDILVLASNVVDTFINHPKVVEKLNLLRMNLGTIEPSVKSEAITFVGKLPSLGLEIYSYDEWYLDDEGKEQPMIPDNHIIMGVSKKNKIVYGAHSQYENKKLVTIEGTRIPKYMVDEDNEIQKLRLVARPVPVPSDIDSWIVSVVQ